MTKAFAYLRVSGKGQVEGDGFERQLLAIQKYAGANGIKIVRVFREEGVSGTTEAEERPAWMEMLQAILSNGTKTIVIERLDRVARKLMVQEAIVGDLQQRGISLLSTEEPDLLNDDPTRVLLRQFLGAIAQYEKSMIVLKLRGARQRAKAKTGRCEGRKPYGTRKGESETIDQIKELRKQGLPLVAIARVLNSGGTKSRAGNWHPTQISRILSRS
jgi:DNA invertase Pin-like site-specific DNA recombinase